MQRTFIDKKAILHYTCAVVLFIFLNQLIGGWQMIEKGSVILETTKDGVVTMIIATDVIDQERLQAGLGKCFGGIEKNGTHGGYIAGFTPTRASVSCPDLHQCLCSHLSGIVDPQNIIFQEDIHEVWEAPDPLRELKKQVISEKNALITQRREIRKEFTETERFAESIDIANHHNCLREKQSRLKRINMTLQALEAAIERIADGSYGTCTVCGDEVHPARLAALPWTPFCTDCAEGL